MNKKRFGIKTVLQIVLCLLLAILIWFVVQYSNMRNIGVENEAYVVYETLDSALGL